MRHNVVKCYFRYMKSKNSASTHNSSNQKPKGSELISHIKDYITDSSTTSSQSLKPSPQ